MNIHHIEARDLPDLWFQAVHDILDHGQRFVIDRGSYEGQTRLEYDFFIGKIDYPATDPLLPDIPPSCGIPNPVEEGYIFGGDGYERSYVEYLMTGAKQPGESYTYGERLTRYPVTGDKLQWLQENNSEIVNDMPVDGKILFEEDGQRFHDFSIRFNDILVDFSKNIITRETIRLLIKLAKEVGLDDAIEKMYSGDLINQTEGRPVLHTALRNRENRSIYLNGKDVMPEVNQFVKSCGGRLLITIHDELVVEMPKEYVSKETATIIKKIMTKPKHKLGIPLKVDYAVFKGKWGKK